MQITSLIAGANKNYDYQLTALARTLLPFSGVIRIGNMLSVTSGQVDSGECFILCSRANGNKIMVHFHNTAAVVIDTTGTKKVYIEVDASKIQDGSSNSLDGTGISAIKTGPSYPSSNYIPLATIVGGVITDDRVIIGTIAQSQQNQEATFGTDTGSQNALAVTLYPAPAAYKTGMRVSVKAANGNTGATTINVNGLGAKTVKKLGGTTDLVASDIAVGAILNLEYDGTNFQLVGSTSQLPVISVSNLKDSSSFIAGEALSANQAVRIGNPANTYPTGPFQEDWNSLDTNKWTTPTSTYSVSAGILTMNPTTTLDVIYTKAAAVTGDFDIAFYASLTASTASSNGFGLSLSGSNTNTVFGFDTNWNTNSQKTIVAHNSGMSTAAYSSPTQYHDGTYRTWRIKRVGTTFTYYIDWVQVYTATGPASDLYFFASCYNETARIDWISTPEDATKVYKSSASVVSKADFFGFATSNASQGANVSVGFSGIMWGFSSLITGAEYFLSDTPGAISSSAGTITKKIGKAISTSQIIIPNVSSIGDYTSKSFWTNYQADTDGFVVAKTTNAITGTTTNIYWYTDATTTPTTQVMAQGAGGSNDGTYFSISFPVKKWNYWRVDSNKGSSLYFVPLR